MSSAREIQTPDHAESSASPSIEVVLPAHNEADGIGQVLNEFYDQVAVQDGIPVRFLVCEDGSADNTLQVLNGLANALPLTVLTSAERKGYSRAVIDGLRATTADLIAFIDSDGQCDPADMASLVAAIHDADLVVGYRHPRVDPVYRKIMSGSFKCVYRILFPVRLHDPSCPFLILTRPSLQKILNGDIGRLKEGFWWEFNARAVACGLRVVERPVHHRVRVAGVTKVYRLKKIPGIALAHLLALFALRRELKRMPRNPDHRPE